MAFTHSLEISRISQSMIPVLLWKDLFICKHADDIFEFGNITPTFYGKLIVLFELSLIFNRQH